MIRETIVTTRDADGGIHVAPMGIHERGEIIVIAPFRPSRTLDNLQRSGCAVVNLTDDVSVFAGCLSGRRRDWPTLPAERIDSERLAQTLVHLECEVQEMEADELRPRFVCRIVHRGVHGAFQGLNRAQAAVIEAAILISRLDRLPEEKIDSEVAYLRIAVDKTAGPRERQAWEWLMARLAEHRRARSSA